MDSPFSLRPTVSGGGSGEANTGSNLGSGVSVFKAKVGVDFEHRTLYPGANMEMTEDTSGITFAVSGIIPGETNTGSNVGAGVSVFKDKSGVDLRFRSLVSGTNVTMSETADNIVINASGSVSGPGAVTDSDIALFDGATGNKIKSGGAYERDILWYIDGDLEVAAAQGPTFRAPFAGTFEKIYANVDTSVSGSAAWFDVNKNGSSIWSAASNRLSIADGATSGFTSSFDTASFAESDAISFDVDAVGSTVAGADGSFQLRVKKS